MRHLEVRDFAVKRGGFRLGPLSLDIEQGEIFAILGRTGAGKTVLLEAMAGMFRGDRGRVLLDGRDVVEIPPGERGLGLVYQDNGLFPHMTVKENIEYGLKMHRRSRGERERRSRELMAMLGIEGIAFQYPGTLSGGESQRTALARALALEPELLLLDEPFSALDPATRRRMQAELKKIHRDFHCTMVFVTHDFGEAQLLADRVGILLEGQLQAVAPGAELMERSYCREVDEFLGRTYK